MNKSIYLDHSATTPVDKNVLDAMLPYFSDKFGNASSLHTFGQEAAEAMDTSRSAVADFFGCVPEEIVFTSGATESNNLAVRGLLKSLSKNTNEKYHIITSTVEHDAILEPFIELEKSGVEVSYAPVQANGVLDIAGLKKRIKDNTVLISIMYVNSEVGAIMPVSEIGEYIRAIRKDREARGIKTPLYFHTDATQAVNFLNCNVDYLGVDMLSMSAHKIYGPKGIGALYIRKGTPVAAMQLGGHHEGNRRSGTYNTPGMVGLAAALKQLDTNSREENNKKIAVLRDMLIDGLVKNIPDIILNTDRGQATPAHAHFSIVGVEGESMLMSLDMEGIAVSTGSACASGSLKASHVLLAMGIKAEIAHSSIRFSLGKHNTEEDIRYVIKTMPPIVERLRKMAPKIDWKEIQGER